VTGHRLSGARATVSPVTSNESVPVRVLLVVEVDGHALRFEETGRAWGQRYHGEDPTKHGGAKGSSLEDSICITVDQVLANAGRRAEHLLSQMYPVHLDEDRAVLPPS
jgi:hypothetical protein